MHRTAITETRLVSWLQAGRGQGFQADYRPWIQVSRQDHASTGQSHIIPDPFNGRQHHLLSNLERAVFLQNLAHPAVIDIREQYPLWPFEHPSPLAEFLEHIKGELPVDCRLRTSPGTWALARDLGIRHAKFVGLNIPYVYTTDQLLTIQTPDQGPGLAALSIKYWSDLRGKRFPKPSERDRLQKKRRRLFQKLRLERAYWRDLGIPWALVTERHINSQVQRNLEWALSGSLQRASENDLLLLKRLVWIWRQLPHRGRCIDQLTAVSQALQTEPAVTIRLFKLALLRGLIRADLTRPVHLQLPFPFTDTERYAGLPTCPALKTIERRI